MPLILNIFFGIIGLMLVVLPIDYRVRIIFIALYILIYTLCYHVIKYRNPYKLFMVFGKKGSGKSTLMCKLAMKYNKKGFKVYCNTVIPGTYYFDTELVGFAHFPENSVLLIDEVGMIWDNRDFKSFKKEVRNYFKLQRHYKHIVYLFSQSFDVDKKLRDLTDNMYMIFNFCNFLSIARRVTKTITISHADSNVTGESKIVDDYKLDSILLFMFGTVKITYIPKYAKYFNTYDAPQLKIRNFEYIPIVEPRLSFRSRLKSILGLFSQGFPLLRKGTPKRLKKLKLKFYRLITKKKSRGLKNG